MSATRPPLGHGRRHGAGVIGMVPCREVGGSPVSAQLLTTGWTLPVLASGRKA